MRTSPFKKTKIVSTLGPATDSPEMIQKLMEAGVDVFRLNMSHMDRDLASDVIAFIRRSSLRTAILVDLQGPKIRLTEMDEAVEVAPGDQLRLCAGEEKSTPDRLYIPFAELIEQLGKGNQVLINDGLVRLAVVEREDDHTVVAEVLDGGTISSRKGVAVPDLQLIPERYLDDEDERDLRFAARRQVDFVAASFVSQAADVEFVRSILKEEQEEDIAIIAKIESRVGVNNIQEIIDVADGIMIARGDLGVEIPPEEVPIVQKRIIKLCKRFGKPVIVATQMLESMTHSPVASRAETSDVANAILDGTDAVMLSGETSVGNYPLEAVRTMGRIARFVEAENRTRPELFQRSSDTTVEFICKAAARACEELDIEAIVAFTASGFTARNISSYRPRAPIYAVAVNNRTVRRLALNYGVFGIQAEHIGRFRVMIYQGLEKIKNQGLLENEDLIVVMGGLPVGKMGSTNLIQVDTVAGLMEAY